VHLTRQLPPRGHLVADVGVATIPGSSFYVNPADGASLVRFCFSKTDETIREAERRLAKLTTRAPAR
jgi:aminotransferase